MNLLSSGPGFRVTSPCGRVWFVPLDAVGQDYADFLKDADALSPEAARRKAEQNKAFWPTWFAEQCTLWVDIERLGTLVYRPAEPKTLAALNRRRGRGDDDIQSCGGDWEFTHDLPRADGSP